MYPYGYGYYFDPTYILIIIGVIITMIASSKMNSTFRRYSRVRCHCGLTGSQAAERILNQAGIYDVSVERVSGNLTDHYDPKNKVLRLSDATYGSDSIAAIGVAAHECGHAVQHQQGYAPLKIRGAMVPAVNLGSNLSWLFILGGVILGMNQTLLNVGILLFSLAVIFQLVTLRWNLMPLQERYEFLEVQGSCTKMKWGRQGRFISSCTDICSRCSISTSELASSGHFIWWKR